MIDEVLLKKRFEKSLDTYDKNAIVQIQMGIKLIELIDHHVIPESGSGQALNPIQDRTGERPCDAETSSVRRISFKRIFEFGVGSGNLTRLIAQKFNLRKLYLNDIVKKSEIYAKKYVNNFEFIEGNIEEIDFPKDLDLIISNATVQWTEDFDKLVEKAANSLNTGGLYAFTTFGENNFTEIQQTLDIGLKYLSAEILIEKLQKHFEILYFQEEKKILEFKTPKNVLKHIQNTGVNCMNVKNFNKSKLLNYNSDYKKLFSTQQGVKLTYHPIYIVAQKISKKGN